MKTNQSQQPNTAAARRVASGPMKIFAGTCGEQSGIPEPIYQALVESAREVWHLAKVRAVSLERNKDARTGEDEDGVTCTLQWLCWMRRVSTIPPPKKSTGGTANTD